MFFNRVAPAVCRRRIFSGRGCSRQLAALFLLATIVAPLRAQRPVDLHVFRFWRPPDFTYVETFSTIPLSLLHFERVAGTDMVESVVDRRMEVQDSAGLSIFTRTWQDTIRVPAMSDASLARSDVSQHFAFQVKPGTYQVKLEVKDGATGRQWSTAKTIEAYSDVPHNSDLVIAGDLVPVTEESPAASNAIVRGKLAVIPNFTGALTAEKARLALYTEVYRPEMPPESAQVQVIVRGTNSDFIYRTPPQRRVYPTGIGSEAFALNLTGLPPGSYDLSLQFMTDADTVGMSHAISMLPPGAGEVALAQAALFEGWTELELDSLFGPMRYIATNSEVEGYDALSGEGAKRRFLTDFWRRRVSGEDETAETLIEDWLDRLQFVNRDFQPTRRGQGHREGWQTDRGRIYMKFGPPAERLRSSQSREGDFKGCEVWRYLVGRGDRYVFLDRTGFGDYDLVFSTDRNEPGLPEYTNFFRQHPEFACEMTPTR